MSYCTCRINSVLNFGKYKGKKVNEVLLEDPAYLIWAFKSSNCFPSQLVIDKLIGLGLNVEITKKAQQRIDAGNFKDFE